MAGSHQACRAGVQGSQVVSSRGVVRVDGPTSDMPTDPGPKPIHISRSLCSWVFCEPTRKCFYSWNA